MNEKKPIKFMHLLTMGYSRCINCVWFNINIKYDDMKNGVSFYEFVAKTIMKNIINISVSLFLDRILAFGPFCVNLWI